MQGRKHYYEGYTASDVVYPIRVIRNLGVKNLLLTNAAGGINVDFKPGTLMMISDHINLTGNNPLRGPHHEAFGARFPDMSTAYATRLQTLLKQSAEKNNIALKEGVYIGLSGPCYETPAEIRMLRTLGGDAVGMSTVYEAIVANQMGLNVAGVSCITNPGAGVTEQKLSHQDVMETAERVKADFIKLLSGFLDNLAQPS